MNKYCTDWLFAELPELIKNDVLTEESAGKIKDYYENQRLEEEAKQKLLKEKLASEKKADFSKKVPLILSILSAFLIAGGIISLIAYNWAVIPRLFKALTAIFLLLGTQGAAIYLKISRKNIPFRTKEAFSLFWALLFGAVVAFVSQIYRFPSDTASFLLVWSISSILISYVFKSSATFVLALIQIFAYMASSWNGNLGFFYILTASLIPLVIQKQSFTWQKYTLFFFSAILSAPIIFRLPGNMGPMFFFAVYSSLFIYFILRKNKDFRFIAAIFLLGLSFFFASHFLNEHFYFAATTSENESTFEHVMTYFVSSVLLLLLLALPVYRRFFKKEKAGAALSLLFVPLIFPAIIFLSSFNQRIAFSVLTLCSLVFCAFFAIRDKGSAFPLMLLSFLCMLVKAVGFGFPFLAASVFTLFLLSLLLLRENLLQVPANPVIFVLLRVLTASFFVFFYIGFQNGPFATTYRQEWDLRKWLLEDSVLFLPQFAFSVFTLVLLAKKNVKKILLYADIFANLIILIALKALDFTFWGINLGVPCNILLLLNASFAIISYVFFKKSNFLPYIPALLAQTFAIRALNENETELTHVIIASLFLLHVFGRFCDFKWISKILSAVAAVANGILFFIDVVLLKGLCEYSNGFIPLPTDFWSLFFLAFILAFSVLLCVMLIRTRKIFNIAMLLHVFLLMPKEPLQILAIPAFALFCLYYLLGAYMENSLKKANITTVYFTAILMIRFFVLGYGLVSQGIALILLGFALLLINRFLRKKQ